MIHPTIYIIVIKVVPCLKVMYTMYMIPTFQVHCSPHLQGDTTCLTCYLIYRLYKFWIWDCLYYVRISRPVFLEAVFLGPGGPKGILGCPLQTNYLHLKVIWNLLVWQLLMVSYLSLYLKHIRSTWTPYCFNKLI